jgi:hypothetical protein
MKILVIQDKSEIRDYLQFALGAFESVNLSFTGSVTKAIDQLHTHQDIACIFVGNKVTKDSDPKELLAKILTYCSTNNTILIGTNKGLEDYSDGHYIHPLAPITTINRVIKNILELDIRNLELENFIAVPFELCSQVETLPCDLHFKIGKGEQTKHIKRYLKGSSIDSESMKAYTDKSLINVFVKKEDYKLIEKILMPDSSIDEPSKKSLLDIQNAFFDSLKDSIDYGSYIVSTAGMVGFDKSKTHLLAEKLQKQVKSLSTTEKVQIEELFHFSLTSKDNIDLKINSLCSIISTNLVKHYSWGTLEMVEMLMFASTFHNIGLSGSTKLITVITEDEYSKLNIKERDLVDQHANYSSSIVGSLDFIHPNVKKLIKEQHGFTDGDRFIGKKKNSSNFTAMFRIVSELATELVKEFEINGDEFNALKVIEREKDRNNSDYPEIYDALIGCVPK